MRERQEVRYIILYVKTVAEAVVGKGQWDWSRGSTITPISSMSSISQTPLYLLHLLYHKLPLYRTPTSTTTLHPAYPQAPINHKLPHNRQQKEGITYRSFPSFKQQKDKAGTATTHIYPTRQKPPKQSQQRQ